LSAWLSQAAFSNTWLTLEDAENDPVRFLAYLAAALHKIDPPAGEVLKAHLQTSPLPAVEILLTPLINQLGQIERPFWLVLDDYHLIQNQVVHQVVGFLLEHRSPPFHLIIATRADPPLPLAKLRARSEMLEIRQADLCFSITEASDFLSQTMGLNILSEDVARITARTEGWIAGLQMAALSMQNIEDISGFITTLTGNHRYIFNYLLEEVLERQPPEIRHFLLCTSILDQLSAPLCDALFTESGDTLPTGSSSVILDRLERTNLFIIPLDHEHRWYRYHSLFADLLQAYLKQKDAGRLTDLHNRASTWFQGQGRIADAIRHALMVGNWERVAWMISANVFALLEQNELNTVARQLDHQTGQNNLARPWIWIGRAWLAAYTGQLNAIDSMLDMVETAINSMGGQADRQTLRGHCAAIRAFSAWSGGRRDIAIRAAREALDLLPETDRIIRCQSATVLGLSMDDMNARAEAFSEALGYAGGSSVSHVVLFTYGCQAYLRVLQGRLREAYDVCRKAMQLADSSSTQQPVPTLSHVYSTLSLILWEWDDLEGALRYGREAVSLARRWEQVDALHFAYTNLGNALFSSGDVDDAFNVLRQAWQIARRTSPWFEEITLAQEVEWHLAQGNPEDAFRCLNRAQVNPEKPSTASQPRSSRFSSIALISGAVLVAQKHYAKALAAFSSMLDALEDKGIVYLSIRVLTWQAMAYAGLGQKDQALVSLEKALSRSAPEGCKRSFFTAGGVSAALLHQALEEGIMPDFVGRLLALLEQGDRAPAPGAGLGSGLIEPLSGREMEVLKLLVQGCSDKKIAETLVIARETVHKHLKNIYGKLGVHSRGEAVARARELGLL
jgi:LuxR family maltose regulon positive regulatory protein